MKATDKEIRIVNKAYDTYFLRDIAGATGLKTQDIYWIRNNPVKTEKVRKLIDGCRALLEEDLEELKILLNKD